MTEDSGLRKYRKEIDRIDDEILKLLNQRCELVRSIGALKEENSTPVFFFLQLKRNEMNSNFMNYQQTV